MSETTGDAETAGPSMTSQQPNAIPHDSEYYFEDSLVTLQVEHRLFRVHQYFLIRDSEFFRDMFSLPQPQDSADGQSDDKPIRLEGVTVHELKCLLRFLYSSMYGPSITALDDWIALLSISTRYIFDRIRDMSIQEISTKGLDPIRKVTLAEKYNIPLWLSPAFVDLCKRPEPLTLREAEQLGMKTVVRLAKAREIVREKKFVNSTLRSYFPHDKIYTFNDFGIMEIVQDIWPECVLYKPPGTAATSPLPLPVNSF